MIHIYNSDGTIWNRDQFIVDLAYQISQQSSHIDISTNGEGPCAKSLGLYSLLDQICERFNYTKKQITLHTCNLVENHSEYHIHIAPQMKYLNDARKISESIDYQKNFDADFKHFGIFVGHGNFLRLHLSSLLRSNYKHQTCQTYHCDLSNDYHRPFISVDELLRRQFNWSDVHSALNLIEESPITLDLIDSYPILSPATLNIAKSYKHFFVEIVCLTYFSGDTFYIDEKIWRPILLKTPFIVQGPQWFLKRFRKLGFKTFDAFWNEGYSEDVYDYQPDLIAENLARLSTLSIKDLQNMHIEMQQILDHNFDLMMSMTSKDFLKLSLKE